MAGHVFYKIAWDVLASKLSPDFVSAFEPEAGLPPIKGMMAQTQGGASVAVNARRWCIHYLYAALGRIEELEATCAGPDAIRVQEALPDAIRKLPADLQVAWIKDVVNFAALDPKKTKPRLQDRAGDVVLGERLGTALKDAQDKNMPAVDRLGSICSAAVEDSAELVKAQARVKDLEAEVLNLKATIEAMTLSQDVASEQEQGDAPDEITRLKGEIQVLRTKNDLDNGILDPILKAAMDILHPNWKQERVCIGAQDVIKLLAQPKDSSKEIRQLQQDLQAARTTAKVYYTGWKRRSSEATPGGMAKLAMLLGEAENLGIPVPMSTEAKGLAHDEEIIDAVAAALRLGIDNGKKFMEAIKAPEASASEAPLPPDGKLSSLERDLIDMTQCRDSLIAQNVDLRGALPDEFDGKDLNIAIPRALRELEANLAEARAELESTKNKLHQGVPQGLKAGRHQLYLKSYHIPGLGQLPDTMEFVSDQTEIQFDPGSTLSLPTSLPLQATYVLQGAQDELTRKLSTRVKELEKTPDGLDALVLRLRDMLKVPKPGYVAQDGGPGNTTLPLFLKFKIAGLGDWQHGYNGFEALWLQAPNGEVHPVHIEESPMASPSLEIKSDTMLVLVAWTGRHPSEWDLTGQHFITGIPKADA